MKQIAKTLWLSAVVAALVAGTGLVAPSPAEAAKKKKVRLTSAQEKQIRRELERRFGKRVAQQIEREARAEARRRGLF